MSCPQYDVSTKNTNSGRSALVIFESPYSAAQALKASPFTVRNPTIPPTAASPQAENSFTCTVTSINHMHHISMRQNPYYNAFLLHTSSIPVQDLIRTNDRNHAAPTVAHADCFSKTKKSIPLRLQERILHNNAQIGANSLMGLWKEGLKAKAGSNVRVSGEIETDGTTHEKL